jgi:hypothetical protein
MQTDCKIIADRIPVTKNMPGRYGKPCEKTLDIAAKHASYPHWILSAWEWHDSGF